MSNNQSKGWVRDIILLVTGAVLALLLAILYARFEHWQTMREEELRQPEKVLNDAEIKRRRLTETDLASAVEDYKGLDALLDALEKKKSLDETTKRRDQALAYSGLSRAYADWATLRSRRGLSRGDFSDTAQVYALKAITIDPEMTEAQIALAYTYDSSEADKPVRSATQAKVKELLAKRIDNSDTQYLAWTSEANEKAMSFPNEVNARAVSDLRILLDVALDFAGRASQATTTAEKDKLIGRSEEFLTRAEYISQNNALVLFVRGYLSATKGQIAEARDYYLKAIMQEPAFPRARHNLGFTYAAAGKFRDAKEQFEAAVRTEGAPTQGLRVWLDSLGEVLLELGDNTKACQRWEQAAGLPDPDDYWTFMSTLRRAMCAYGVERDDTAAAEFGRAVEHGKKVRSDPTSPSWLDEQNAGPKVREIIKALNQMAKKPVISK